MQRTLRSPVSFEGRGLHSGHRVRMTIRPAMAEFGIWFRRIDIADRDALIPALWNLVEPSALCTRIANEAGASVSTIEHLMAALAGCGVHNAVIEIDGPEVPILDGSALPFVRAILSAGLVEQNVPVRAIEVLRPVSVSRGEAAARLEPAETTEIEFEIVFEDAAIGRQRRALKLDNGTFVRELCDSRTFCRLQDVEAMRAGGLALGGSLENAVVVDGGRILTPGGLRRADEPVRHKMLDALGDLALAGGPILGRYVGRRAGHALTNELLRALFADPDAFRMTTPTPTRAARLPGVGVSRAEIPALA